MRPVAAMAELEALKAEAEKDPLALRPRDKFAAWKSKVEAVLSRALGAQHHTTETFRKSTVTAKLGRRLKS